MEHCDVACSASGVNRIRSDVAEDDLTIHEICKLLENDPGFERPYAVLCTPASMSTKPSEPVSGDCETERAQGRERLLLALRHQGYEDASEKDSVSDDTCHTSDSVSDDTSDFTCHKSAVGVTLLQDTISGDDVDDVTSERAGLSDEASEKPWQYHESDNTEGNDVGDATSGGESCSDNITAKYTTCHESGVSTTMLQDSTHGMDANDVTAEEGSSKGIVEEHPKSHESDVPVAFLPHATPGDGVDDVMTERERLNDDPSEQHSQGHVTADTALLLPDTEKGNDADDLMSVGDSHSDNATEQQFESRDPDVTATSLAGTTPGNDTDEDGDMFDLTDNATESRRTSLQQESSSSLLETLDDPVIGTVPRAKSALHETVLSVGRTRFRVFHCLLAFLVFCGAIWCVSLLATREPEAHESSEDHTVTAGHTAISESHQGESTECEPDNCPSLLWCLLLPLSALLRFAYD